LIDLAGSERVERSEAIGDRLKEAQYINKSLSALGDVIFALAQKNAHVPYRNSKLTQVLQSSLGGQAKTLMFVQINPDVESYSETISTLKFAERVSGVELGAARSNKEGKDIKELLEQVASLKDTISRKDMEIEQLQLIKDKVKPPNLSSDRNGAGLTKNTVNQPSQLFSGERMLKSSDRVLSDPLSYAEANGNTNHNSTDIAPGDLDEAEYEGNASDDGLSAGETENFNSDKAVEMTAERHRVPSRITRFTLTKNGQPSMSRSKPKDAVLKTPSNTKAPSSQLTGGSSARGSKRWQ
jgi:kinesin family protein C2/C3